MAYSPLAVANEFVKLAGDKGVDHMKLQKLVYYTYEEGVKNKADILNEYPQVWKFGPVFPSLYAEMKYHGSEAIRRPESEGVNGPVSFVDDADTKAKTIIHDVWNKYRNYSAIQLSTKTHNPGTPWYRIVKQLGGKVPMGRQITPADVQ